jgi:hypothetical protein
MSFTEFTGKLDDDGGAVFAPFTGELDKRADSLMPTPAASTPSVASSGLMVAGASGQPKAQPEGTWDDPRTGSWQPEPPSRMARVGGELRQLRDEVFSGVDQATSSVTNINAVADVKRLDRTRARLADLERRGQGDSIDARQMRSEIGSLEERMSSVIGRAAEAAASAQRGSEMVSRPAVRRVSEAKTFGEAWEGFKEAPYDVIAGVTAQSMPQMLPGLIAAAVAGPGAGAVLMGLGSGAMEFGGSISEFARERGINPGDEKQLKAFLDNPEQLGEALKYAGTRAGVIGAVDAVSGGIAGKTIAPAMRSKLGRQAVNIPAQMGVQAGMGGAGEAGAQLATKGEIDQPGQVLMEAAGEFGSAPVEVASLSREIRDAARRTPEETTERVMSSPTVDDAIRAATEEASAPLPAAATPQQEAPAVQAGTAPAARPESAAAVDNIARILGQESADVRNPVAPAGQPAGSGGTGSPDGVGSVLDGGLQPDVAGGRGDGIAAVGVVERGDAAVAAGGGDSRGATALAEPIATWVGRRGDGYATQEDAQAAMPSRQRARADLDWKIERTPEGRFRLAGYPAQQALTQAAAPIELTTSPQGFRVTRNPSGTVTVQGDPQAIRQTLATAGVDKIAASPNGVMVGLSQAERAMEVLAPQVREVSERIQQLERAQAPVQPAAPSVRELALQEQRAAGWNTDWPFVPADLGNADFRAQIQNDPGLSDAEKIAIFEAGRRIGVVPKEEAATGQTENLTGQPAPQFRATLNPTGTLTIQGDPEAIKAILSEAGISGVRRADGVLVGTKQAGAAQKLPAFQTNVAERGGNPFRTFLMRQGVSPKLAREFAPGTRERLAMGRTFREGGLELDALAERAVEQGFISDRSQTAELYEMISRAVAGERIAPLVGQDADLELQAQFDARRQDEEDRALAALAALSDNELAEVWAATQEVGEPTDLSDGDAAALLGFDEQENNDAGSQESQEPRADGARGAGAGEAAGSEAASADRGRAGEAGQDEGLTSPSEQDILAQQERRRQGERAESQRRTEEENRARADAERNEFALTGSDRAADGNPAQRDITDEAETDDEALADAVGKLPAASIAKLESHYNARNGTSEFLSQLREDVVSYVTAGARSVSNAVRSVIKTVAEGVLAASIVLNPAAFRQDFAFDMQSAFERTETALVEVRDAVPQDALERMSALAQDVYERMAPVARRSGKGFMVADKPNGMLHVFNADGSMLSQAPALYGKSTGDILTPEMGSKSLAQLTDADRVTPAGTFTLEADDEPDYVGGKAFVLRETRMGGAVVAVHAAYLGNPSENRVARLASPAAEDNRISAGCINTTHEQFLRDILPRADDFDGGMVFVLPDETERTADYFPATRALQERAITRASAVTPTPAQEASAPVQPQQESRRQSESALIELRKRKEDKARAKEVFAEVWPAMLEKMGPKFGQKQLRETLDSMVKWEPAKFLAMAEKFKREQGGAFDAPMQARGGVTQTEAFKKWFGDSKVVDAEGKPLVVYHGTTADLSFFDKLALGANTSAPSAERAFFFAASPKVASGYAMLAPDRPTLRRAVMENAAKSDALPADLKQFLLDEIERQKTDDATIRSDMAESQWIVNAGGGMAGANVLPLYLKIENPLIVDYGGRDYRNRKFAAVIAEAQANGNDGVIFRNAEDSAHKEYAEYTDIYAVFEPTQAKSATGNRGTFDSADPDITHKRSDDKMPSGLTMEEAREQIKALRGMRKADVQSIVDAVTAKWVNGPRVTVVQTAAELPGDDNPADVRGLYMRGHVWIVAGAHRTAKDAKHSILRTLAHESIAHFGLRAMLGRDGWNRLMRDIQLGVKSGNKELQRISAYVRKTYVDEDGNFMLSEAQEADEIAAKAVEEAIDADGNFRPGFAFLKAAFARVAQFLREIGIDVTFTNAELQGMLVLSMQNMERGERTAGGGSMVLGGSPAARARDNVISAISKIDRLFRLPKSEKDTVAEIAAEVDPAIQVKQVAKGRLTTIYSLTMPDGTRASLYVRKPNPYGSQAYGMMERDGELEAISERPGTNPEAVDQDIDDVYVDVSKLKEGGGGLLVYNIAATFAHNTGRIFIGDPASLSDTALRRRTEQMLSSALKFGTTRHLAPHPRQVEGDRKLGVPGMRWTYGDDLGNIESLVQTSLAAFDYAEPNPLTFEPSTGRFIDRSGAELDDDAISRLVEEGAGREARAGVATLKRNAILRALLPAGGESASARGRSLLEGLLDVAGQPGAPADRVFYARSGVADQAETAAFDGAQRARGTTAEADTQAEEAPATSPTSPWRDPTGRLQFAPGAWLYDKLGKAAGPVLTKLQLKTADPKLKRILREMRLQVQKAQDTAAAVAGEAMKLTDDERAMVSDLIEQELRAGTVPPDHAVRLAAMINTSMGAQTDELVRLGMLSAESAEMWRGKYLPRYYQNKLGKQVGDAWADAMTRMFGRTKAMAGIKGKHLKGRGLYETIPERELPHWEAMGWEVRDPDFQPGLTEDGTVQVWRDFSRAERDSMGEIRDAGFRFVMGYMQTQRDIALGRMFEQLAQDPEMSSARETEAFGVRVPDGTVTGTGAKRYGKLAGRWVSKDTFSHLTQIEESQSEAWQMYRKALAIWKESKTALNPVSHANNIISNLTMAHFAGVGYLRADKYLAAARDFAVKAPGITEARDAGLFLGTMSDAELMNVLPEDLKALVKQQDSAAKKIGSSAFSLMTLFLRRPMGAAYQAEDTFFRYLIYKDARERGLEQQDAVDYAQRYIFAYDDLPKGARMIRDVGIPFFSYTYKAVPALLHTALTHPVRMIVPAAVLWGINAASYAIATGDDEDDWLEKLQKYITDEDYRAKAREKEKLEREHLPPWMKGYTSIGTPRTIRLGTDEVTKLPLFIDTARIVPGGDLFDVNPNAGGIPWLQPLTPSNPLLSTYMAMFGNRDSFFGKDLVDKNDTRGEATAKRADWLWKQLSPAIAIGNYHFERGMNALAQATGSEVRWLPEAVAPDAVATGIGRDGLPVQSKYAAAQTFGIKIRPLDLETSEAIDGNLRAKMIRDIDAEMRSLRRLNQKGAVSDSVYERKREQAETKKDRLRENLTVDGEERD